MKTRKDFPSHAAHVAAYKAYIKELAKCERDYQKQLKDPMRNRSDVRVVFFAQILKMTRNLSLFTENMADMRCQRSAVKSSLANM